MQSLGMDFSIPWSRSCDDSSVATEFTSFLGISERWSSAKLMPSRAACLPAYLNQRGLCSDFGRDVWLCMWASTGTRGAAAHRVLYLEGRRKAKRD